MRVLVSGLGGHMGQVTADLLREHVRGGELTAGVDLMGFDAGTVPCASSFDEAVTDVDVVVDFSHHSCTEALLAFCKKNQLPLVLATTGQTPEELDAIQSAAKEIPLFFAANFSLGVALLIDLAKKSAQAFPNAEIEIVEIHHDRKVDAPSGTALAIGKALQEVRPDAEITTGRSGYGKRTPNEIGIQAVRIGNVVGIHEVLIGTGTQTITLKHEAHSRALFAEGALDAAAFLVGKGPGLYDMNSLIG